MAFHHLVAALRFEFAATIILTRLLMLLLAVEADDDPPMALPGCQSKCGNVSIPYPFGIGQDCYKEGFKITCNETAGSVSHLEDSNIVVVNIQMAGRLVVNQYKASDCYLKDGSNGNHTEASISILGSRNYRFSDTRNKFFALGCDTMGYLDGTVDGYSDGALENFQTGCLSVCNSSRSVVNGTCSGIGCCEASIPKGLRYFDVFLTDYKYKHTNIWEFNPCSYGFVADANWLNFSLSNYTDLKDVEFIPVTLDWAIMDGTCEEAKRNKSAYACVSNNSYCSNSSIGPGYLCNCSQGFNGSPYFEDGCQDIDECKENSTCVKSCKNLEGSYQCSCPWHMYGDGKVHGSGCKSILKLIYVVLGGCLSFLFVVSVGSWMYWTFRKKRLMALKEKFFQQNGGFLLQQQRASLESTSNAASMTRLFSAEELESATDNYNQSRVLGEGGAGTVYKGVLPDSRIVAIKKSKVTNSIEIEQFINEVVVLSRINHRNVVGLLGCCLETQVPLLVYEFIPNGTLFDHIHSEGKVGSLSYEARLRIASEVAGSLSYLHSAAAVPIIHRDVKSTNILLDENLTAKVSDFGASKLVPIDQKGLVSLVRGTFGYLDPEYLHSGEFTDKSDVYSFGVVLVELITGRKPIDKQSAEHKSLAALFTSYVKDGRVLEIMEHRVLEEGPQQQLMTMAKLVERCLCLKGEERPSMKEVSIELEGLRRSNVHPWAKENEDELELLLGGNEELSAIVDHVAFGDYDSSMTMTRFVPLHIIR